VRYAVYFAPDRQSPWRQFGASWLGRDEHDSTALPQPALAGIAPAQLARITQEPRRYGFHATLKAPFQLAEGQHEASLIRRLDALARTLRPLALGPLRLARPDTFLALVPETTPPGLQALAAACVTGLDELRAPLAEADLARRRLENPDARALELLTTYGYPHVMERFRFHLTLTGPVDESVAERLSEAIAPQVARLNAQTPLVVDRLCLFVEKASGEPFHRILDLKLSP